ncbi:MAG: complex I NDUFA9 subunit family protein, partial [Actinomycetota bacterium]|nr:complex I NDUFA9 subunit family protein [Actinomycetota bacterium]
MRVVVAGGTGFVGRYIARALLAAGHDVTVLTRHPDRIRRIPQLDGADGMWGDATDPTTLHGALQGMEAVVGVVTFPTYPAEIPRRGLTFDRYDRQVTENLVRAAEDQGVARFLYISGAGADPASDKTWYRAKGRAEAALRASDLEWAIVRPSWAYGPEDRALNRFVQIARVSPVIPKLGVREQWIQPVFVADVGAVVARIFARDDTWQRVYEVGGPDVLSMTQVIETMLDVTGRRRLIVPVPVPLLKLGVAPLLVLPRPPMPPGGIEFAV